MEQDRKEYFREYYRRNKERYAEHSRRWDEAHRDERKEAGRQRYHLNIEESRTKQNAYLAAHPEKVIQRNHSPKARYYNLSHSATTRNIECHLSFDEYLEVVKGNTCHYCGQPLNLKRGHGVDRKDNEPYYRTDNAVPCCGRCNTCFMDHFSYKEKLMLAEAIKDIDLLRTIQV